MSKPRSLYVIFTLLFNVSVFANLTLNSGLPVPFFCFRMKSPSRGGVAVPLPGGGPMGVPGGGAWWHARLYGPEGGYPAGPGTYRYTS
jgi:hypothetical protein